MKTIKCVLTAISCMFIAQSILADNIKGIDFVQIGDANKAADTHLDPERNGYGSVGYNYKIGVGEISFSQFSASDVGSGNENHWTNSLGSADAPAVRITWHEAARYCNWLTSGDAKVGAYTIDSNDKVTGALTRAGILASGETYFVLPTEDEWYKAAYYNGSGYSRYANGTDTVPELGVGAMYKTNTVWTVQEGLLEENNDTHNMMGNVWEWTESPLDGSVLTTGSVITASMAFRGGAYNQNDARLGADHRESGNPTVSHESVGMRVVVIPEPGTISLMSLSTVGLFITRSLRRRKRIGSTLLPVRREPLCDTFYSEEELRGYLDIEGEVDNLTLISTAVKSVSLPAWQTIYNTYKSIDKAFWDRMVIRHEVRVEKRRSFRMAVKIKTMDGFDTFLALIMK
jgi:sulfatase modifying factor 1